MILTQRWKDRDLELAQEVWGAAEFVECLSSKHKATESVPSAAWNGHGGG